MKYKKGYYKQDGNYVPGHYINSRSSSYLSNYNICKLLFLLLLLLALSISCSDSSDSSSSESDVVSSGSSSSGSSSNSGCPTKTCGDFATRAQAQAAYNSNKICYKNLDADGDGIACENLK